MVKPSFRGGEQRNFYRANREGTFGSSTSVVMCEILHLSEKKKEESVSFVTKKGKVQKKEEEPPPFCLCPTNRIVHDLTHTPRTVLPGGEKY